MTDLSIVTPLYRTSKEWPELVSRLQATLDAVGCSWECVAVDDACPGNTGMAPLPSEVLDRIEVLRLGHNVGQHAATGIGLAHTSGDLLAIMDSDLQDRPEDLPILLESLDDNVDVAVAVDRGRHQRLGRRVSGGFFRVARWAATLGQVPVGAGMFLVVRRRTIDDVLSLEDPMIHLISALNRVGARFRAVSIPRDRRATEATAFTSPMRVRLGVEALLSATPFQPVVSANNLKNWSEPRIEVLHPAGLEESTR